MKSKMNAMNALFGTSGANTGPQLDKEKEELTAKDGGKAKSFSFKIENMGLSFNQAASHSQDEGSVDNDAKPKSTMSIMSSMGSTMTSMPTFGGIGLPGGTRWRSASAAVEVEFSSAGRVANVMTLMEDLRLQCPPTHSGLVLAYSGTTRCPLSVPTQTPGAAASSPSPPPSVDIMFKWHRIDASGKFRLIDQGTAAWYAPTADDIGRKICLQCEDSLGQGFCRYVEAGPLEADPLLVSMMDSSLNHGRFEIRDVSATLSCSSLSADSDSSISEVASTDDGSAAVAATTDDPLSLSLPGKLRVEVGYGGLLLGQWTKGENAMLTSGLRLFPSEQLVVQCTLPCAVLVTVPLAYLADPAPTLTTSADEPVNATSDLQMQPSPEGLDATSEEGDATEKIASEQRISMPVEGNTAESPALPSKPATPASTWIAVEAEVSSLAGVWEWVGGPGTDLYDPVTSFMAQTIAKALSGPGPAEPRQGLQLRITITCSDRMQRDALALSIRAFCSFDAAAPSTSTESPSMCPNVSNGSGVDMAKRLQILPWFSGDGTVARGGTVAAQDVSSRLKQLEEDNDQLRKQKNELTVQVLELNQLRELSLGSRSTDSSAADVVAANVEQMSVESNARIRELEGVVGEYRTREVDYQRQNLELTTKLRRLTSESEAQAKAVTELRQHLAALTERLTETATEKDRVQAEKATLAKELTRLEAASADTVKSLSADHEKFVRQLKAGLSAADEDVRTLAAQRSQLEDRVREGEERAQAGMAALDDAQTESASLRLQLEESFLQQADLQRLLEAAEEAREKALRKAIPPSLLAEVQAKLYAVVGERNHWQRKAESLSKDLRRVMHEAADRERDLEQTLERRQADLETLRKESEASRQLSQDGEAKQPPDETKTRPAVRRKLMPSLKLSVGSMLSKRVPAAVKEGVDGPPAGVEGCIVPGSPGGSAHL